MLAGNRTIVFLVGRGKLLLSLIDYVIDDFLSDKLEQGRVFSDRELFELESMRDADYFSEGFLFNEVLPYVLPFLEKESLKDWGGLG